MNVRQAFLRAADSIESDRSCYEFYETDVHSCGTPMCMWGWIGHHLGMAGKDIWQVAEAIGQECVDLYTFGSMSKFADYDTNPLSAAGLLRLYADHHFPESRALIPESVARIFRMSHAELVRELEAA